MKQNATAIDIVLDWEEAKVLGPAARAGLPKQKWEELQSRCGKSEFSYPDTSWVELSKKWESVVTRLATANFGGSLDSAQKDEVVGLLILFGAVNKANTENGFKFAAQETAKVNISPRVSEEGSPEEYADTEIHYLKDQTRFKSQGWRGELPQSIIEMTERVKSWDGTEKQLVAQIPNPVSNTEAACETDAPVAELAGKEPKFGRCFKGHAMRVAKL